MVIYSTHQNMVNLRTLLLLKPSWGNHRARWRKIDQGDLTAPRNKIDWLITHRDL